jgi:tRNA threonylcarbamoyladenosine biosynthesis protein TsaB
MILAIKTAGIESEIHLVGIDGSIAFSAHWESGRSLSTDLLQRILDLLKGPKYKLTDIVGIVIFSGPGSFTSLRIGHAVANALADSLNVHIVGSAGDNWIKDGTDNWSSARGSGVPEFERPALPVYGAEAHITKPKP